MAPTESRLPGRVAALAALALVAALAASAGAQEKLRILHYTYTGPGASRHVQAMDAAEKALKEAATRRNWETYRTEDPAYFTDANLAPYHVIFFDNVCCASIFKEDAQRRAVERFLRGGKGYVGSHAATASEPGWAFWTGLHGGVINNGHPDPDTGVAKVEFPGHPSTQGLPARWNLGLNEWFTFHKDLRTNPKAKVLVSLPKGSVISGHTFQEDLPVSWCTFHEGARAFYSSLGHFATAFTDPSQRDHFFGALEWAGGRAPRSGACGEPPSAVGKERPFAARVFAATLAGRRVGVEALQPGRYRVELFDPAGRLRAFSDGTAARHALEAPGPGVYALRVRVGGQGYQQTLAVPR